MLPACIVNITNSKIYGNSAASGPDIWNDGCNLRLNDSMGQLTALYAEDSLVPLGWFHDYPTDPIELPTSLDHMPVMLKMVFEESTPDPEPDPTPDPTPNPDPEPTPDSTPETDPTPTPEPDPNPNPEPEESTPEPSRPSNSGSHYTPPTVTPTTSPDPDIDQGEPKAPATLTNGKAVLTALEALYWAGYNDSRGWWFWNSYTGGFGLPDAVYDGSGKPG